MMMLLLDVVAVEPNCNKSVPPPTAQQPFKLTQSLIERKKIFPEKSPENISVDVGCVGYHEFSKLAQFSNDHFNKHHRDTNVVKGPPFSKEESVLHMRI